MASLQSPGAIDCHAVSELDSLADEGLASNSSLSLSILDGPTLCLWSGGTVTEGKTAGALALQLQPDQAVIIGRQEGGRIEYLDERFQPTRMLPSTGHPVVTTLNHGKDACVSRGHFMLRGLRNGIQLVNGVPRRGGGIRAPKNGTLMMFPVSRQMAAGEEFLIKTGTSVTIRLPNTTVVLLQAE